MAKRSAATGNVVLSYSADAGNEQLANVTGSLDGQEESWWSAASDAHVDAHAPLTLAAQLPAVHVVARGRSANEYFHHSFPSMTIRLGRPSGRTF